MGGARFVKIRWPDLLAGLAISGLVVPEALAYAGIAGAPPLAGLMAAVAGMISYARLGTSRYAIVAATSSSAAVLAAALPAIPGMTGGQQLALSAALVISSGVLFLLCSALGLGAMAAFIARPVVRGFSLGIAAIISVRQFATLCGLHATHTAVLPLLLELYARRAQWHGPSLLLGLAALALLLLLRRVPRMPATLVVLALGTTCLPLLGAHGAGIGAGISVVGPIAMSGVHPRLPELPLDAWVHAAGVSLALMLVLFAESYGAVRSCALRHGDTINVNRELLGLGVANVAAGLFQGLPVGAGYSATYANESLGARSRLAGVVAAAGVVATLCFLRPWVARIPEPVLAAIVIYSMRHALGFAPLRPYLAWKRDRAVLAVAVGAVLCFGILNGLLVAIAVSLVLLIRELSQPRFSVLGRLGGGHDFVSITAHLGAVTIPGMLILRPEEPLFFGNVEAVLDRAVAQLAAAPGTHMLILSLEESPDLDGTAIEALGQFAAQLRRNGCELRLARLKDPVLEVLDSAALPGLTGAALSSASVDAVVAAQGHVPGGLPPPVLR
jgi:sulfate permease, SulP family